MKMNSLSRVGVGLSVVFTCLLLALVAEIYYLLWWKRRIIKDDYRKTPTRREFFNLLCWKKQYKSSIVVVNQTSNEFRHESNKNTLFKPLDNENNGVFESSSSSDVIMFTGPPRFLFTIKEETKEDLEFEDERLSRQGKRSSLNDLMLSNNNNNTPFLTPLSSPPFLTPMGSSTHSNQSGGNNNIGYNPFYEASSDAEFNKIVKLSPPPKFKFLRDAEEKLQKKLMLMEEAKMDKITIIVDYNQQNNNDDKLNHHYHSPLSGDSSSSSNRNFKSFLAL